MTFEILGIDHVVLRIASACAGTRYPEQMMPPMIA